MFQNPIRESQGMVEAFPNAEESCWLSERAVWKKGPSSEVQIQISHWHPNISEKQEKEKC